MSRWLRCTLPGCCRRVLTAVAVTTRYYHVVQFAIQSRGGSERSLVATGCRGARERHAPVATGCRGARHAPADLEGGPDQLHLRGCVGSYGSLLPPDLRRGSRVELLPAGGDWQLLFTGCHACAQQRGAMAELVPVVCPVPARVVPARCMHVQGYNGTNHIVQYKRPTVFWVFH